MLAADADYRAWLAKANNDRLNIENNLKAEQTPWDTVCFHAQQCAEKTLKALLVYHDTRPQRTHDLVLLLRECVAIDPALADIEDVCQDLTTYAVTGRYPDLSDVGEAEGRQALAALEQIRTAMLPLLPVIDASARADTNAHPGD